MNKMHVFEYETTDQLSRFLRSVFGKFLVNLHIYTHGRVRIRDH